MNRFLVLERGAESPTIVKRFGKSVWLFPALLLIPLLFLTYFKINGSSLGVYQVFFNGSAKDANLLLGKPRLIRSDEWNVNTQLTIAQKNNGFHRINTNIGDGQDMSVLTDAPYKEWSEIFKPHNWAFFIMPFDNAFAFRWWFMAYLLIISCYFFVLSLMPDRRFVASVLSLALLFSAFIQWWYLYITLGSICYTLFLGTVFVHLTKQKKLAHSIMWGLLMLYLLICFILILYPPFQIACGLVIGAFCMGYFLERRHSLNKAELRRLIGVLIAVLLIAGSITLLFLGTRSDVIRTINNTVYPGKRIIQSGGYNVGHLLSGHLDGQLVNDSKATYYQIPNNGITNQSEDSGFILLILFLFMPSLYVLYWSRRSQQPTAWTLVFANLVFILMLSWLLLPHLGIVGKITLLDKVPHNRLMIGLGLVSLIQFVLLIRQLEKIKNQPFLRKAVPLYIVFVFIVEASLSLYAAHQFPGFIGVYKALLCSLPVPIIVYLILRKKYAWATVGLLAFSLFTAASVNPLYHGTGLLTKTPLSNAIQEQHSSSKWIVEDLNIENFASINGAPSLSGVYAYPQLSLWKSFGNDSQAYVYNRYAHVGFNFDRDATMIVPTNMELVSVDHFSIQTEACSRLLQNQGVGFILTDVVLPDSCLSLVKRIVYPARTFYIYRIT